LSRTVLPSFSPRSEPIRRLNRPRLVSSRHHHHPYIHHALVHPHIHFPVSVYLSIASACTILLPTLFFVIAAQSPPLVVILASLRVLLPALSSKQHRQSTLIQCIYSDLSLKRGASEDEECRVRESQLRSIVNCSADMFP
jgi:hypothetical protein